MDTEPQYQPDWDHVRAALHKYEIKRCPRCGRPFECKAGNIPQCQCSRVLMPHGLPSWVKELYDDCLCPQCLRMLAQEATEEAERASMRHGSNGQSL
ncbi:MAG: cysteine-rich CWC family protein [Puniceicoccales bacterium]